MKILLVLIATAFTIFITTQAVLWAIDVIVWCVRKSRKKEIKRYPQAGDPAGNTNFITNKKTPLSWELKKKLQ